jgi:predicted molibdopterin-dependent oxidoreductase YjgC
MSAPLLFRPSRQVSVTVDGQSRELPEGMMLAPALASIGVRVLRQSPRAGAPRGAFCLMGACQECTIHVDGTLAQACMTSVRAGMKIELRGAG